MINDTDLLIVNRDGVDYKVPVSQVMSKVEDTDWLLANNGSGDRKLSGLEFANYISPQPMPWDKYIEDQNGGGAIHIENVSGGAVRLNDGAGTIAWDSDGTNERFLREVPVRPTHNVVVYCPPDATSFLASNTRASWNFGALTNMSGITKMGNFMRDARVFNGRFGGNWDTKDNTNMRNFMFNAKEFNQDIGHLNTESCEDFFNAFKNNFKFNQDISSWFVGSANPNDPNIPANCFMSVFENCRRFNQDLTSWCVDHHTTGEPFKFSEGCTDWDVRKKPVWGTCPGGRP